MSEWIDVISARNLSVEAVNYALDMLLLDDGSFINISTWYDDEAQECDKHDAIVCVAGPDAYGLWYNVRLSEFEIAGRH